MPSFGEPPSKAGVTQLLKAWGEGDDVALKQLTPVVENELHRIAHRCMAREKPGHTLQSAALVNEVYLRLVDIPAVSWQDRAHFFAMCARLMRRILTDYARSRNYQKRGGGAVHLTLDEGLLVAPEKEADIMALDDNSAQLRVGRKMMVNTWLTDADYLSDLIVGEPIVPDCLNQSLGGINDASGRGGEFTEALHGVCLPTGR